MSTEPRTPRVWVTYKDSRKDMSKAERYGQLTDMFAGRVRYDQAVEQARKMLENYQDGDYILLLGDPTVSAIVTSVALEFSDDCVLRLLRWDREAVEYEEVFLDFSDAFEDDGSRASAEVIRTNRYASR